MCPALPSYIHGSGQTDSAVGGRLPCGLHSNGEVIKKHDDGYSVRDERKQDVKNVEPYRVLNGNSTVRLKVMMSKREVEDYGA